MNPQYRRFIIRIAKMAVGIKLLLILLLLLSIGYGPLNSRHRREAVLNYQLVTIPLRHSNLNTTMTSADTRKELVAREDHGNNGIEERAFLGTSTLEVDKGETKSSKDASHHAVVQGDMALTSANKMDIEGTGHSSHNDAIVVAKPPKGKQTVSIVITNLGLKRTVTELALRMPPEVALGFSPYGHLTHEFAKQARALKHVTLVHLPMDVEDNTNEDYGPYSLEPSLPLPEIQQRLDWIDSAAEHFDGVYILGRSQFQTHLDAFSPVVEWLKTKQLQVITDQSSEDPLVLKLLQQRIPTSSTLLWVDFELSEAGIKKQLAQAVMLARQTQPVVILARPYPLTLRMLQAWIENLDANGIALRSLSQYNTVQN